MVLEGDVRINRICFILEETKDLLIVNLNLTKFCTFLTCPKIHHFSHFINFIKVCYIKLYFQ